jgi:hypothetical protein|tara:strand:- start:130 stop:381 length:252 start_codon:yes stop_codon:yes gene_type:complete
MTIIPQLKYSKHGAAFRVVLSTGSGRSCLFPDTQAIWACPFLHTLATGLNVVHPPQKLSPVTSLIGLGSGEKTGGTKYVELKI